MTYTKEDYQAFYNDNIKRMSMSLAMMPLKEIPQKRLFFIGVDIGKNLSALPKPGDE